MASRQDAIKARQRVIELAFQRRFSFVVSDFNLVLRPDYIAGSGGGVNGGGVPLGAMMGEVSGGG